MLDMKKKKDRIKRGFRRLEDNPKVQKSLTHEKKQACEHYGENAGFALTCQLNCWRLLIEKGLRGCSVGLTNDVSPLLSKEG